MIKKTNIVWFRRWGYHEPNFNDDFDNHNYLELKSFLRNEFWAFSNAFFNQLGSKKWLSHPSTSNVGKLKQLDIAKKCGFLIPDSIIANNKKDVFNFKVKHTNIITKSLTNGAMFDFNDKLYFMYTTIVDESFLDSLPNRFPCSLFQKQIDKNLELRVFYLDGEVFPMAIISQSNKQTQVDFRLYDDVKPNRNIPVKLTLKLENKIILFMKTIGLNTGSLDLIVGNDGNDYFLEVNPVGQFGMTSKP